MIDTNLPDVPDGGELRTLAGNLVILRRIKHEWRDALSEIDPDKLRRLTGKKWGSKFFRSWTLVGLCDLIADEAAKAQWKRGDPPAGSIDVTAENPVGLVAGEEVHTIRIVTDGH